MRLTVIRALAVYGALALISQVTGFAIASITDRRVTGTVLGPSDKPLPGAPVFLDDGSGTVRRLSTDAEGHFRFPIEPARLRRARLLICPAGGLPFVTDDQPEKSLTGTTYGYTRWDGVTKWPMRSYGWRTAIPPECAAVADPTA